MSLSENTLDCQVTMPRLLGRFPELTQEDAMTCGSDHGALVAKVALTHDLTMSEAQEELSDLAFVESLAGGVQELRAA